MAEYVDIPISDAFQPRPVTVKITGPAQQYENDGNWGKYFTYVYPVVHEGAEKLLRVSETVRNMLLEAGLDVGATAQIVRNGKGKDTRWAVSDATNPFVTGIPVPGQTTPPTPAPTNPVHQPASVPNYAPGPAQQHMEQIERAQSHVDAHTQPVPVQSYRQLAEVADFNADLLNLKHGYRIALKWWTEDLNTSQPNFDLNAVAFQIFKIAEKHGADLGKVQG